MKIQYMSDLHLEFGGMPVPEKVGDVLVLAGDIHVGVDAVPWLEQCALKFDKVFYVLGNHEYYGQKYWKLHQAIEASFAGYSVNTDYKLTKIFDPITNVHLLNDQVYTYKGVNFIGSTLWSMAQDSCPLNDFQYIKYKYSGGYGRLNQQEARQLHKKHKNYLIDATKKLAGQTNVVITHHAPSWMANDPKYTDTVIGSGFYTDILEDFDPKNVTAWIYGHTHSNIDFHEHGIHVFTNQKGYEGHELVPNFDSTKCIEV